MKSIRRISIIIIMVIALSSILNVYAANNLMENIKVGIDEIITSVVKKISDIDIHWAKDTISTLVNKGVINGFPDGTFRPDNNITVAEFTKIITLSNGATINTTNTGQWYVPYVEEATKRGIIKSNEFKSTDWDRQITRGEMARMVSRSIIEEYPSNLMDYSIRVSDFDKIEASLREDILLVYYKGIMGGYPDGTFKPANKATRAEAGTMIERLIEPSKRLKVKEIKKTLNRVVYQDELGYGYISGPEEQITDEVMKLAKSIKPLRFEVIADKAMQNHGHWFGFYYLIEHDITELWYKDWTFNIMSTSHLELNKIEVYNYSTQKYRILETLDTNWAMGGNFITYYSHDPKTRVKSPMEFLHFEEYGTREYRKNNKFKEGDVITYKVRSRRPLTNEPLLEKTDVYFIYEQVIEVKLKDLRQ